MDLVSMNRRRFLASVVGALSGIKAAVRDDDVYTRPFCPTMGRRLGYRQLTTEEIEAMAEAEEKYSKVLTDALKKYGESST